jgi:uncharacterized protein YifE (UPF0438 family)
MVAFITTLNRYFDLVYEDDHYYRGFLKTYKYTLAEYELVTSEKNPDNAKWFMDPHGYDGFLNITGLE